MCQKRREVKNSDSRGDVRKRQSVNDKRPLSVLPPSHYSSNNTAAVLSDTPPRDTSKPRNHPGVQRMSLQSCFSSLSLLLINECFWRLPYEHLHPVFLHAYGTPPSCWVCTFVPGALVFLHHCHVTLAWQRTAGSRWERHLQGDGLLYECVIDWLL